jgi:hypothetical protein
MSGGHFDYLQYRIQEIRESIEDYVYGKEVDDVDEYIEDHYLDSDEKEYIIAHQHTVPNICDYSEDTIKEFKQAIDILRKAEIYTQRIDWLLSGDDSEETFHIRLKEDLNKIKNETN